MFAFDSPWVVLVLLTGVVVTLNGALVRHSLLDRVARATPDGAGTGRRVRSRDVRVRAGVAAVVVAVFASVWVVVSSAVTDQPEAVAPDTTAHVEWRSHSRPIVLDRFDLPSSIAEYARTH